MRKLTLMSILFAIALATTAHAFFIKTEKSLYERLGGQKAIVAVVDDFVGNVAADKRINGFFAECQYPAAEAAAGRADLCRHGRSLRV